MLRGELLCHRRCRQVLRRMDMHVTHLLLQLKLLLMKLLVIELLLLVLLLLVMLLQVKLLLVVLLLVLLLLLLPMVVVVVRGERPRGGVRHPVP